MFAITRQGRLNKTFRPLLKRLEALVLPGDYDEVVHLITSRKMLDADVKVFSAISTADREARTALGRLITNNVHYWQYPEFDILNVKPRRLAKLQNDWSVAVKGYGGSSRLSLYIRQNQLALTPRS
jgi:hypothetical protein